MNIDLGFWQRRVDGPEYVNGDGEFWNLKVLHRVDYGPLGQLLKLYEDDTKTVEIEIGSRFFVFIREGEVAAVHTDPSRLAPDGGQVVETTEAVTVHMLFVDGAFHPAPPPPYIQIELQKAVLFDRMTDAEYGDLADSVEAKETRRVREIYRNTSTFIEGSDMWELLVKHLTLTVTAGRMGVLLARPGQGAATADEAGEVVPA